MAGLSCTALLDYKPSIKDGHGHSHTNPNMETNPLNRAKRTLLCNQAHREHTPMASPTAHYQTFLFLKMAFISVLAITVSYFIECIRIGLHIYHLLSKCQ